MQHNQAPNQDDGRRSRFAFDHPSAFGGFRESSLPAALRERASSQPPRGLTETLSARPDSASRRFESPFGRSSVLGRKYTEHRLTIPPPRSPRDPTTTLRCYCWGWLISLVPSSARLVSYEPPGFPSVSDGRGAIPQLFTDSRNTLSLLLDVVRPANPVSIIHAR